MIPVGKTQWRARLRAERRRMQPTDSGARLASVGLEWLEAIGVPDGGHDSHPDSGHANTAAPATDDDSSAAPHVMGDPAGPSVCTYISMGGEPSTGPLLESLATAGFAVYVPVCEPDFQLAWTRWQPGIKMARSGFAPVMEPVGPRLSFGSLASVRAILVPALAVDASGVRLGQGGGYYDRFLAGIPAGADGQTVPLAAVVHEGEVFPAGQLPRDSFDADVGFALTPGGWRALG
ncbi:5-formyltetrahydrofolate cyclo-ligase [Arthrobacter sp. LAPM80]|uniref:5-formyltetrahydrofolate cyclo-ligase n=1 Tax=Arthrobacter sp. LAPM80 TaxID=3141788 RepID=UPI00398B6D9A